MNDKQKKQPEATPETVYFVFFKSYQEAIDKIPDQATQLQIYKAIANYALFGIEPELQGVGDLVWGLILPMLEKSLKRQRIGRKTGVQGAQYGQRGAEHGIKGGRPRKKPKPPTPPDTFPPEVQTLVNFGRRHGISREVCEDFFNYNADGKDSEGNPVQNWRGALIAFAKTADESQAGAMDPNAQPQQPTEPERPKVEPVPTQPEAQAAEVVEVEEVEAVEVVERPEVVKPKTTRARFVPPTVEEVADYCRERGNNIDANEFVDHYTANGWVQGKGKPVKDWRACVRTWERHTEYRNRPQTREERRAQLIQGAAASLQQAINAEKRRFKCTLGDPAEYTSPATAGDTKPF